MQQLKHLSFAILFLIAFAFNSCKKDQKHEAQYPAILKVGSADADNITTEGFAGINNEEFLFYATEEFVKSDLKMSVMYTLKTGINTNPSDVVKPKYIIRATQSILTHKGSINNKNVQKLPFAFNFFTDINWVAGVTGFWGISTPPQFGLATYDKELVGAIKVADGILAFGAKINGSDRQAVLVKYNSQFEQVLWEKEFGGAGNDMVMDAVQLCNNNYGILAYTYSKGGGDRDVWYLQVDEKGNLISDVTFGGAGYEEPQQIIASSGCNLYIAGHSSSFGAPEHDGYLLCITETGTKIWEKTYGTPMHDGFNTLTATTNGLIAVGRSMQGAGMPEDVFVVATDWNGNELWRKKYGDPNLTEMPRQVLADNEFYYIACNRYNKAGNSNAVFIKDKMP